LEAGNEIFKFDKRKMSILGKILNRELSGRGKANVGFREVPLGSIMDFRYEMSKCVLLGFSNTGEYLSTSPSKLFFLTSKFPTHSRSLKNFLNLAMAELSTNYNYGNFMGRSDLSLWQWNFPSLRTL
jgi:hypothetical protein